MSKFLAQIMVDNEIIQFVFDDTLEVPENVVNALHKAYRNLSKVWMEKKYHNYIVFCKVENMNVYFNAKIIG